jgi:hypothetical protein
VSTLAAPISTLLVAMLMRPPAGNVSPAATARLTSASSSTAARLQRPERWRELERQLDVLVHQPAHQV